jgi:hypothetical protein
MRQEQHDKTGAIWSGISHSGQKNTHRIYWDNSLEKNFKDRQDDNILNGNTRVTKDGGVPKLSCVEKHIKIIFLMATKPYLRKREQSDCWWRTQTKALAHCQLSGKNSSDIPTHIRNFPSYFRYKVEPSYNVTKETEYFVSQ